MRRLTKVAFHLTQESHILPSQSAWISWLRGVAAVEVAAAHLRAEMYPGLRTIIDPSLWYKALAFMVGFSHHAVVIFFVLSGWLVGGRLLNNAGQTNALASYAIDRVSRLWIVILPVLLLTLALSLLTGATIPQTISFSVHNEYSAISFAGNLLGVQALLLPVFGNNYSLWSLAYQSWYYAMFALLIALRYGSRRSTRVACGALLATLAFILPPALIGYFLIWSLGVAFSRVRIKCGAGIRLGAILLLISGAVYYRLVWNLDGYNMYTLGPDLLGSILLVGLLCSWPSTARLSDSFKGWSAAGKRLAVFSFSLYALHVPLIHLLKHIASTRFGLQQLSPHSPAHAVIYFAMLCMLIVGSHIWYRIFESQTDRARLLLKRKLLKNAAPILAVHQKSVDLT